MILSFTVRRLRFLIFYFIHRLLQGESEIMKTLKKACGLLIISACFAITTKQLPAASQQPKKSFPLSKVHQLLEPGPVIMVTTSHKGKDNVMPMSWHMMVNFSPPLISFVMSKECFSHNLLKETKECVINIPTVELASKVLKLGNSTGSEIDKFKEFGLSKEKASQVKAPMIRECYASLECKVVNMELTSKYNIFILEVVKAWIQPNKKEPKTIHNVGYEIFTINHSIIKE